jgi:hypothetical protein
MELRLHAYSKALTREYWGQILRPQPYLLSLPSSSRMYSVTASLQPITEFWELPALNQVSLNDSRAGGDPAAHLSVLLTRGISYLAALLWCHPSNYLMMVVVVDATVCLSGSVVRNPAGFRVGDGFTRIASSSI